MNIFIMAMTYIILRSIYINVCALFNNWTTLKYYLSNFSYPRASVKRDHLRPESDERILSIRLHFCHIIPNPVDSYVILRPHRAITALGGIRCDTWSFWRSDTTCPLLSPFQHLSLLPLTFSLLVFDPACQVLKKLSRTLFASSSQSLIWQVSQASRQTCVTASNNRGGCVCIFHDQKIFVNCLQCNVLTSVAHQPHISFLRTRI